MGIADMIYPKYREWLPVRQHSEAHWRCYQSPNAQVFISVGGDIYDLHINIGPLVIAWDHEEE